jgi:hypothetical protein
MRRLDARDVLGHNGPHVGVYHALEEAPAMLQNRIHDATHNQLFFERILRVKIRIAMTPNQIYI